MALHGITCDEGVMLSSDDDAVDRIRQAIEQNNPGIADLEVKYEEGMVRLLGTAESAEAADEAIQIAGNVKGVSDVNYYIYEMTVTRQITRGYRVSRNQER